MISEESKRIIDSLPEKELKFEILLGSGSRFEGEKLSYLKTRLAQLESRGLKASKSERADESQSWFSLHTGPVITAVGAIIAAAIGGVFLLPPMQEEGESDKATATPEAVMFPSDRAIAEQSGAEAHPVKSSEESAREFTALHANAIAFRFARDRDSALKEAIEFAIRSHIPEAALPSAGQVTSGEDRDIAYQKLLSVLIKNGKYEAAEVAIAHLRFEADRDEAMKSLRRARSAAAR